MSQLAHIAQTLNQLADRVWTNPEEVLKAATERGDPFERIVGELDAHKMRALADAKECADIVAAAQRLKEATDARAAAFKAAVSGVVEERCRAIEAEYDALIEKKVAELAALRREKAGKVEELLSLVDRDEFGRVYKSDALSITKCTRQLKQWTGKTHCTIVYDSTVDEFTNDGLFDKVKGKPNIAVVGYTTDGDVFGGFYSIAVTKQQKTFNDPTIFAFSFESHGRCMTPQRFAVKEGKKDNVIVKFFKNNINGFVGFWVFDNYGFRLGNERSYSNCNQMSQGFEGLEDTTLTGKNGACHEGPYYHCTRIVAIQLE